MFVECSPSGWILAAYVEQQYPNQKWVPPSHEALQYFLSAAPRLGKDAKGRTCLLPDRSPVRRGGLADGEAPSQGRHNQSQYGNDQRLNSNAPSLATMPSHIFVAPSELLVAR